MEVLALSTAPFREEHVIRWLVDRLSLHAIPFFFDAIGNIVVGAASAGEYRRQLRSAAWRPVLLYVAHMDHPGFHGARWLSTSRLKVRWFGGSPVKFLNGAKVWLATAHEDLGIGKLENIRFKRHGSMIDTAEVEVEESWSHGRIPAAKIYGAFGFRRPARRLALALWFASVIGVPFLIRIRSRC